MPYDLNGLLAICAVGANARLVSLVKLVDDHGRGVLCPLEGVKLPAAELMETTPGRKRGGRF